MKIDLHLLVKEQKNWEEIKIFTSYLKQGSLRLVSWKIQRWDENQWGNYVIYKFSNSLSRIALVRTVYCDCTFMTTCAISKFCSIKKSQTDWRTARHKQTCWETELIRRFKCDNEDSPARVEWVRLCLNSMELAVRIIPHNPPPVL